MSQGRFVGKAALITGASSGIGRATALKLAREGADVALNYLTMPESAEETASSIRSLGRKAILLLEGTILVGGWQQRVLVHDVLVGPETTLDLEVRCVEQGRWSGTSDHRTHRIGAPLARQRAEALDHLEAGVAQPRPRLVADGAERLAELPVRRMHHGDGHRKTPVTGSLHPNG